MNTSISHQKIAAIRCSILAVAFVIFFLGVTGCSSKTKQSPSEAKAFVRLMEQIEKDEESNWEKVAELRAELVRATTADQWAELAKSKEKAFEASFKSLRLAK